MKFNRLTQILLTAVLFTLTSFSQKSFAKQEDALFASSSCNIYLDNTHSKAIGLLEIGAKVYVINKKGDWYNVKIKGWRQNGLNSIIYAFMGKRILKAELTPNGEKFIKITKTVKDENTDLIWQEVELDNVWVKSDFLVKNMNDVWQKASKLFHARCSMCHALPKTTTFTANQWPATLRVMTKRAALDKSQTDIVSKFLQYHAKDTIKLKEE